MRKVRKLAVETGDYKPLSDYARTLEAKARDDADV